MIDIIVMFVMLGIAEKHVGPDARFDFAKDPGERARLAGFWRLGLPVFASAERLGHPLRGPW